MKRAVIAEPDAEEAIKQTVILRDEGFDVRVIGGVDLSPDILQDAPDVLILRHERAGIQQGLSFLSRLRRGGFAAQTAIVVTTSELPPEAIDRHRRQAFRADAYARLPLGRSELLEAVHNARVAWEERRVLEREHASEESRDLLVVPAPATFPYKPKMGEVLLDGEDVELEDTGDVPAAPGPALQVEQRDVAEHEDEVGHDRTLHLLRSKLRERGEEIVALKQAWQERERELVQTEERQRQKELLFEDARLRLEESKAALERARTEAMDREKALGAQVDALDEQQRMRELDLIRQIAMQEDATQKLKEAMASEREQATTEIEGLHRELTI